MDIPQIINNFHELFYGMTGAGSRTHWMGVPCVKCPFDLWIYQEIIVDTRPDLIIECGTALAGTSIYLGTLCELVGGRVITIDIEQKPRPTFKRVEQIIGSSTDPQIVNYVKEAAQAVKKVMVILDSDHRANHVLKELQCYAPMVSEGCYLIVEDTNVNGHPIRWEHGAGPAEAIYAFLSTNKDFMQDHEREKFLLTFNPGGYLKRITPRDL